MIPDRGNIKYKIYEKILISDLLRLRLVIKIVSITAIGKRQIRWEDDHEY
jgi:hypothetical protein